MSGNTLAGRGERGKTAEAPGKPVYMIGGDDEYAVTAKAKQIVGSLVPPEQQVLGLEIVEGGSDTADDAMRSLGQCLQALQTLGFLGGGKVIWLKDAGFLAAGAKERSKEMQALVDGLVSLVNNGLPAGQKLVITMPKLDGRSALYKACERNGEVLEFAIPEKSREAGQQAVDSALQEFKRAGVRIGMDAAQLLVERVGCDTRLVTNEAQKLILYVGQRHVVTVDDVRAVVATVRETAAWDFADAVGDRNLPKALKVLRQLMFQKESHIGLVAGLERRIGVLIVLRTSIDRGWARMQKRGTWGEIEWVVQPDAETALGSLGKDDPRSMHPFRAFKLAEQAEKFTLRELLSARERVSGAREQMVTTSLPPFLILELLLAALIRKGPSRA